MEDKSYGIVGPSTPPGWNREEKPGPLFVDLDGTLVATDTFQETLVLLLRKRPWALPRALLLLLKGRARLKRYLGEAGILPDVRLLPYRSELVAFLNEHKARGGTLVLATASDSHLARRIADHVGLFDEVLASDGSANLKGELKLRAIERLCDQHGWSNFAYIGDSRADLPIWSHASEVFAVAPSRSVISQLSKRRRRPNIVFPTSSSRLGAVIKAIRPHHWSKNLLVFLPLLLAHAWGDSVKLLQALLAFLAFSLAASSAYVTNDLCDLESDRRHPSKRSRPFASGSLPVSYAPLVAGVLLAAALTVSLLTLPVGFVATLALYLALNPAYSLGLKRKFLVGVFLLAGLYILRLLGGAYATNIPISEWLLAFSGLLFLSLAFVKRYPELARTKKEPGS